MKIQIRLLEPAENGRTRELYERIFDGDTREFVDYYYQYKARENRIYVAENEQGEICSMLHLNPYLAKLGEQECFSEYIVAVATEEKCRHQGLMRRLLAASLEDMRRMGEPFAFLMPAAEAIYHPFDFRYIYRQRRAVIHPDDYADKPALACRAAEKADMESLEAFARTYLEKRYRVFNCHTAEYLENLLAEQACQGGEVVLLLENGQIQGYFFTSMEAGAEIREPVAAEGYEALLLPSICTYLRQQNCREPEISLIGCPEYMTETQEEKPLIMARVVNPETFAMGLTAAEPVELLFRLEDSLLPENTGVWRLTADSNGGHFEKLCGENTGQKVYSLTTATFTELAFGYITAEEAGFGQAEADKWEKIHIYSPSFLNEVV